VLSGNGAVTTVTGSRNHNYVKSESGASFNTSLEDSVPKNSNHAHKELEAKRTWAWHPNVH